MINEAIDICAEILIKTPEEQYRQLIKLSTSATVILDNNYRIFYINIVNKSMRTIVLELNYVVHRGQSYKIITAQQDNCIYVVKTQLTKTVNLGKFITYQSLYDESKNQSSINKHHNTNIIPKQLMLLFKKENINLRLKNSEEVCKYTDIYTIPVLNSDYIKTKFQIELLNNKQQSYIYLKNQFQKIVNHIQNPRISSKIILYDWSNDKLTGVIYYRNSN